jgi:hypothetical protein
MDMKALPPHLLPLVPLFCRSLTQMGTSKESFIELTERIGRKTGGLSISPFTSPVKGKTEPITKLMVGGGGGGGGGGEGEAGAGAGGEGEAGNEGEECP